MERKGLLSAKGYGISLLGQEVKILKEDDSFIELVGLTKDSKVMIIDKKNPFVGSYKLTLSISDQIVF